MADTPWIRWFTSDYLTGIADLEADEIGVYTVMLALQADRGGPIEDDPKWLARRCGTSTRRFNQIRRRLLDLRKLEERDGLLGNRRMLSEIARRDGKSAQARSAAMTRWQSFKEPELDLRGGEQGGTEDAPRARALGDGENRPIISGNNGGKAEEQIGLISGKSEQEPQKTANPGNADAPDSARPRRVQTPESRITSRPNPVPRTREAAAGATTPEDGGELAALVARVCEAAGHQPFDDQQRARALRHVRGWRDAGFDFDQVVIPTIRSMVAESAEPTRTLGRFTKEIRHEDARRKAKEKTGKVYRPPPSPVLEVEDEEPIMRTIRAELLQCLGAPSYCAYVNEVRLERQSDMPAGRTPLLVVDNRNGRSRLMESHTAVVQTVARRHGFNEVWER